MRSKMSAIGTSDSAFHDGNPSIGELGTIVTADWLNDVQASTMDLQDELLNVLAAASVANNSAVKTQILAAINYLSNLATFAADTGTANAYVATLSPALTAYADGVKVRLKIVNANTGSSTLNVNGLGAKTIYGAAHIALQSGELVANGYAEFEYVSSLSGFVLLFCTGAAEQITTGSKSQHAATVAQVQSQAANYIADTGTANTYIATLVPAATSYYDGMKIRLKVLNTNTGASTLNVNGLGAKSIYGAAHVALQAGELLATGYAELEYSSTLAGFVLLFCTGASLQIADASKSKHALNLGMFTGALSQAASKIKIPYLKDDGTLDTLIVQFGYATTTSFLNAYDLIGSATYPQAFPTEVLFVGGFVHPATESTIRSYQSFFRTIQTTPLASLTTLNMAAVNIAGSWVSGDTVKYSWIAIGH